jgi:hypothetical protein
MAGPESINYAELPVCSRTGLVGASSPHRNRRALSRRVQSCRCRRTQAVADQRTQSAVRRSLMSGYRRQLRPNAVTEWYTLLADGSVLPLVQDTVTSAGW